MDRFAVKISFQTLGQQYNTNGFMKSIHKIVSTLMPQSMKERYNCLRERKPQTAVSSVNTIDGKYQAELEYWKCEVNRIIDWYTGKTESLCGIPKPEAGQLVNAPNKKDAAILTWHKMCAEEKYKHDLDLPAGAFRGMRALDLGSGPVSGATVFEADSLYCVDPLLPQYMLVGFPIHYYNARYAYSYAEAMPFPDGYFDVVIAVNSIDHVDDFEKTATEIGRVLKPRGALAIHAHYHPSSECEPIELNDDRIIRAFHWCDALTRIGESKTKLGHTLESCDESYVLWKQYV